MLCLLPLSGCVSYPNYPSGWSSLEAPREDCESLSGAYWNRGYWNRSGASDFGISHLATKLFHYDDAFREGVERVEITAVKEGALEVKAIAKDGTAQSKRYLASKGEFTCSAGKIEIPYSDASAIGGPLVMGASKGVNTLAKAQDGSLVVKDAAAGVGLVLLVIPAAMDGHEWSRFESVATGKPADPAPFAIRPGTFGARAGSANEPAPPDHSSPESMAGNMSAQWWELFKVSSTHGKPDLKALCKAADLGDVRARREMGYLYYHGLHGVRKDPVLSAMWYGLVESYRQGPDSFNTGREQLTPEQLTELKSLYINWKPGHCEGEIFGSDADIN